MFELNVANAFASVVAGFPAIFAWLTFLLVIWLVSCLFWWIDDYEGECPRNPLISWWMRKEGYEFKSVFPGRGRYYSKDEDCTTGDVVLVTSVLIFFVPTVVYWSVVAPFVPATIAVVVLVAFLARSGRRVQKMLKKHMEDKTVHREIGE